MNLKPVFRKATLSFWSCSGCFWIGSSKFFGEAVVKLSNFELSNFELSNFELSNFELSNFELSNFELSNFELSKFLTVPWTWLNSGDTIRGWLQHWKQKQTKVQIHFLILIIFLQVVHLHNLKTNAEICLILQKGFAI